MIETLLLLFLVVVLFMIFDTGPEKKTCSDGHKWSMNALTDKLECLKCGMKL